MKVPAAEGLRPPRFQFTLYVPSSRNGYFAEVISGARHAAADLGAVLSVHSIDESPLVVRFGAWTGSDGIAVCSDPGDPGMAAQLERLRRDKMHVVLVNHNVRSEQPWPFIGTNLFDYGKKIAVLLTSKTQGPIRLVMVYSAKNPALYAERELVEMGIHAGSEGRITLVASRTMTDRNPRQAEQIVHQLVKGDQSPTALVFTDSDDTVAGTQALIDLNAVGRIGIVGFGAEPSILASVKKGILWGTVAVNPDRMGYQAVRALVDLSSSGFTSAVVDTGIDVITAGAAR